MSKILISILLLIGIINAQDTKSKLCKEWKIVKYEINNDLYKPDYLHENDKMIFYSDSKLISTDGSNTTTGFWSLNEKAGIITVENQQNEEIKYLIIEILTNNSLVLLSREKEGYQVKYYFKSCDN